MDELSDRAWAAYRTGWSGDLRPAHELDGALRAPGDAAGAAWLWLLSAQRWHAQPDVGALPDPSELRQLESNAPDVTRVVQLAAIEAGRAYAVRHDDKGLESMCAAFESRGLLAILHAWRALALGDSTAAAEQAATAGAVAADMEHSPLVIEAVVVRALAAELADDLEEATSLARRASRMARTEGFPQSQYLANVVLARVRRLNGGPHLATRILTAVARVVPAPFSDWLAWELLLAGAIPLAQDVPLETGSASLALRGLIAAAAAGDSEAFDANASVLTTVRLWPAWRTDVVAALGALDPRRVPEDPLVASWCCGDDATPPGRIQGLCVDLAGDPDAVSAFVHAEAVGDSFVGRRLAGLSVPLARARSGATLEEHKPGRNDITIAALALAGPEGLPREELFRAVYGFAYKQTIHRGLFKALIHRVREELSDHGTLHHVENEDRFALSIVKPILVPDPRCAHSLEDQMLLFLARHGNGSAKGAAGALKIPLRTAQTALKNLVEDGAIAVERNGRRIEYRLEDTTFKEPTVW